MVSESPGNKLLRRVSGLKQSVSCSDPEYASHRRLFSVLCVGEFMEPIFDLHRSINVLFTLIYDRRPYFLFLTVRQDILCWHIFSCLGGRDWISYGVLCYWNSDLRSTVHREYFLCAWSLHTGESFETERELAQRRIHFNPHWNGFLIFLVFFPLGCSMSPEVLTMCVGLCTSAFLNYNFKRTGRQPWYLDLIVVGPVSWWHLWTYHASSNFLE